MKNQTFKLAAVLGLVLGLNLTLPACQVTKTNCLNDYAYLTFAQIDADKDGKLKVDEYMGLFLKVGSPGDNNARKRTFYGFDGNSDEIVTPDEFKEAANPDTQRIGISFGGCTGVNHSNKFP